MKPKLPGTLVLVDTSCTRVACDACREAHCRCSRGAPPCVRCRKLKLACTRHLFKANHEAEGMARRRLLLATRDGVPETWEQGIVLHSKDFYTQYYLRRYLMPLALLLPKPSEEAGFERIRIRTFRMNFDHVTDTRPLSKYPAAQLQAAFGAAMRAFFRCFNPFYPLFSEEGFLSKPRSLTLLKTVIQIGLERLPETDLTRAAMAENGLVPGDFENLPLSLDTLQCLLLVDTGVWSPLFLKTRAGLIKTVWCMVPLLGLHLASGRHGVEGTLAYQMLFCSFHHMSIGQSVALLKFTWFEISSAHLHPRFLERTPFACAGDRVHFIASTTVYHSFVTVTSAHRLHARALRDREPAQVFQAALDAHIRHLRANFEWGWQHLAGTRGLLAQTRLNLALRYNNDHLELMTLAMHIPLASHEPISQVALTKQLTEYSRGGLATAIRSIRLVSTIAPSAFDFNYVRVLIPAMAFVMIHCKAVASQYRQAAPLTEALALALQCLKRARQIAMLKASAESYLELFGLLAKHNRIAV